MKQITIKSALIHRLVAVVLLTFGTASVSAQYYMNVVQKDGEKVQYLVSNIDSVYFSSQEDPATNYEYVDLGLSVKWATCNVGATKPEEYGDYFAWGETETKTNYSWSTYKWCNGSNKTFTKYCNKSNYGNDGFTDTKTTLDPEDDVAHVKWGGKWRMPTIDEQIELINKCAWTWFDEGNTEFNGVAGYKVTSKKKGYKDRFIFLPAVGGRENTTLWYAGEYGHFWSSSLYASGPDNAELLSFYWNDDSHDMYDYIHSRFLGQCVRPVCP